MTKKRSDSVPLSPALETMPFEKDPDSDVTEKCAGQIM
jgi:hypothetical protein